MKKNEINTILTILLLAIMANLGLSQEVIFSGKVIDENTHTPIQYVNVVISNPIDNSMVKGAVTDVEGNYSILILPGTYDINFQFLGLKKVEIKNVNIIKQYQFQTINMVDDIEDLGVAIITAERTTVSYELDKKIYHVGKDILSAGGSAQDILGNVPSVTVDNEGAISLRGNSNVKVLINGKPSVLTANGGLESIPSENIEKIEISTNPSSKHDADGTAGILNIILKKNKQTGFSASAQLIYSFPSNNGANLNISYKTEKINIFSNIGYRNQYFPGYGSNYQTNQANDSIYIIDADYERKNSRSRFNIYFGGDYYINDKNTMTLSFYHRNNVSNNEVLYGYKYFNNNLNKIGETSARLTYEEPQKASQIELNYVKEYAKKGQKLTANIQYDFWNDDENENITQHEAFPVNQPLNELKSRDIESSKDILFQLDFSKPIFNKSNISVGIKGEIRNINSEYQVWSENVLVDSLDNLFQYKEGIYGAYIQYGNKENKFQYALGLRIENAHTQSKGRRDQDKNNKRYTDLFPTAHLTYVFNKKTSLQLSYSRRISRPRFYQLNPFGGISDSRYIRLGNPNLDPMYTNSLELGTLIKNEKLSINPSLYFSHTTNLFARIRKREGSYIATLPVNLGTEDRYGAELIIQYSLFKWLKLTGEANYYTFNQTGDFEGINYSVKDNTITSRLRARIKFKNVVVESSFNSRGKRNGSQAIVEAQNWFDLGINMNLLKEKATLGISINNLLNTRTYQSELIGSDYNLKSTEHWYVRRVTASFKYRFNRKLNERDRQHR